jgi:hypothetical protein
MADRAASADQAVRHTNATLYLKYQQESFHTVSDWASSGEFRRFRPVMFC